MRTGADSEYNRYYIARLRIGMTGDEVWDMMGRPHKIVEKSVRGESYDIWYYVTKGKILGQTKLLAQNLTPLVFQNDILKGWGRRYYNYLFDVDNARERYQSRERQQYTDDRDEWAPDNHGYIPSPYEKEQAEKKAAGEPTDEELKAKKSSPKKTEKTESKKETKNPYERVNKYTLKKQKESSGINQQK